MSIIPLVVLTTKILCKSECTKRFILQDDFLTSERQCQIKVMHKTDSLMHINESLI